MNLLVNSTMSEKKLNDWPKLISDNHLHLGKKNTGAVLFYYCDAVVDVYIFISFTTMLLYFQTVVKHAPKNTHFSQTKYYSIKCHINLYIFIVARWAVTTLFKSSQCNTNLHWMTNNCVFKIISSLFLQWTKMILRPTGSIFKGWNVSSNNLNVFISVSDSRIDRIEWQKTQYVRSTEKWHYRRFRIWELSWSKQRQA